MASVPISKMFTCVLRVTVLAVLSLSWVGGQVHQFTPPPGEGYPRPTVINGIIYNLFHIPPRCQDPRVYTYPKGGVIKDKRALIKQDNPHRIDGNIEITPDGCLYIEPGSVLLFSPGYGIRVNGTLIAWGSPDDRITFTKDPDRSSGASSPWPDGARLVDGNTTLDGRLELKYHGKWRGVCTNYVNFTKIDANVTCRSLGFLKGNFTYHSFAKNVSDYLLFERPLCEGTENDLLDCPGKGEIRMGRHVCDGQQVIGFECEGFRPDLALDHWRGIEFINSTAEVIRIENSAIIINESLSRIEYADISYAGVDSLRDASKNIRHPMATISANPHPPNINDITLMHGAHDGLNFTDAIGSVRIANTTISHNRGHGMLIRTIVGRMLVNTTNVTNNWGDGIKFHMINYTIPRYEDTFTRAGSFCQANIPTRSLPLFVYQDLKDFHGDIPISRPCLQRIRTSQNRSITVHFLLFERDPLASGTLKLFDGSGGKLLETIHINNGSYPQSVSTTGNELMMEFHWNLPLNRICPTYKFCLRFLLEVYAEYGPDPEFRLINSSVSNNTLHGVSIQDMRSKVFFNTTEVSFNNYEAGIRIFQGAGEVTINNTLVEHNALAGVNITYSGGYILINNTRIYENNGYGVITEYDRVNKTRYELRQKMEVVRSDFALNEWTALRIGNYCRSSSILMNHSSFSYNFEEGIEFLSCNRTNSQSTNFSLAFNTFSGNQRHSILISPMLYTTGIITNCTFKNHEMGAIRLDNGNDLILNRWYADFPVTYNIFENTFELNSGRYVVSMRLTQASPLQKVFFKFNRLVDNFINETFPGLNPRSRANAVVVLSSGGVVFERNYILNPDSVREVSTHLTDPSVTIMATRNWWGKADHEYIYNRLFDRDDRYNLAHIEYYPALQFDWLYENYTTDTPRHRWQFNRGNLIGGVLEHPGFQTDANIKTYYVDKDIYLNPGVPFFVSKGTQLVFSNSLGMVAYGRLVADGLERNVIDPVVMTLEDMDIVVENVTATVRLEDGLDQFEGRLEVDIDGVWGTVCNEGWVDANAALACQQLGLTYNPKYATPRRRIVGSPGQPVHLADVSCGEMDLDLTKCRADRLEDTSATYCNHSQDVIIRCHPPAWSGVTIPGVPKGGQEDETQIRHVIIEKAGLLDAATMEYSPSLRIDYNYHVITNLTVRDGVSDGIDIKFTHPISENRLESCKIENNLGSGIVTRDTALEISYTSVTGSGEAGLRFDPSFTEVEALHIRNSINPSHRIDMLKISSYQVGHNSMVFLVTNPTKVPLTNGLHDLELYVNTGRLTLQILDYNPLTERENVTIFDGQRSAITSQTPRWVIEKDLVDFPISSSHRYLTIRIQASGVISGRLTFAAHSHDYTDLTRTRLYVRNCTFSGNKRGIETNHYNNPSNYKQDLFSRHRNEIFEFEIVIVSDNKEEAMFIPSVTKYGENDLPSYEEMTRPEKVAVVEYIMSYCIFRRNGIGIVAEHNHVDFANNVWHWKVEHCHFIENKVGGFEMELPRVNDREERQIHSFSMDNTVFRNNPSFAFVINGYYANVTIELNTFTDNNCRLGLLVVSGMEKELRFVRNTITSNTGRFMVEFDMDSHSEYAAVVSGLFWYNNIRNNLPDYNKPTGNQPHTYSVAIRGVQNVTLNRNLFENINMQYELVAGVTALSLENTLDVKENWWGSSIQNTIKQRIFDFDDWNNFAIAEYTPYLGEADFNAETVPGLPIDEGSDFWERLGGRIVGDITFPARREPYVVHSDLTVMGGATLKLTAGTELQFKPNVGILVLGVLEARGLPYSRIKMGPWKKPSSTNFSRKRRNASNRLRLVGGENDDEGFLELYNTTSKSYNLMCDRQFNEKTAEVVCRELGKETINVEVRFSHLYDHYVYGRPMFFRKEFWANSFYCKGNEDSLEQCKKRINYNLLACVYAANYTFVRCGERNLDPQFDFWGNIRFAPPSHEERSTIIDDPNRRRSSMEYIDITGAGILHGEKVGAIQATYLAPKLQHLNISVCASNAIDYIAPRESMMVSTVNVTDNLGYGVNVLVLNGESSHDAKSSFEPLVTSSIPYNLFGMVEICRMEKQIVISERLIVYFKYSHRNLDCVKIITSKSPLNRVSLRFLQINLYNDTFSRNSIEIFDGRTVSDSSMLAEITADSPPDAFLRSYTTTTSERTLVLHMHASPGQWTYGFIAEVVTLPQSGLSYPDSTYHHKIENAVFKDNQDGAILYLNVGEVTPSIFIERCWIENNGVAILNLTSWPAIDIGIQDTRVLAFKNNFVNKNRGGMQLVAKTSSVATRAKINITNNVFASTTNGEALNLTGHHYQRAYIYANDFVNNTAGDYRNVINVENILVNFTTNVVTNSNGHHVLAAYNAEAVPTQQLYEKNIFADCNASAEYSATLLAGRGQPKFVENYLVNPLCSFELLTGSKVVLQDGESLEDTPINATRNWWGSWEGSFINGKIWDSTDNEKLVSVIYFPAKADNGSFLEGKCPAGWRMESNRCYRYLGGALSYEASKTFCKENGGYLAEAKGRERFLHRIVRASQSEYRDDHRVWVYGQVGPNRCSSFRGIYVVEEEDCDRQMLPFLCEKDPYISPPGDDPLILAFSIAGGVIGFALIIIVVFVILWCVKSKRREKERFERRESIRSSVRSARSKATLAGLSQRGTPTHSRARSLDNISEGPRGMHLSGVTTAETSTETIDKPRLEDYYFNKSQSTSPESKGGSQSYARRTDHYINGAYYNGGSTDDEKYNNDDDDDVEEGEEEVDEYDDREFDEDDGDGVSQKTTETSTTNQDYDDYKGQAPPPYQYRPPGLENEISSLRNTPTDHRLYSNNSLDDRSVDLSSGRSKSGASLRTFGSHDSMARPPPYQRNASPGMLPNQHSASQGDSLNRFSPGPMHPDQRQASLPSIKPMYRRREQDEEMGQRFPGSQQPPVRHSPGPYQPQARQSPAPYQPQARQSPAPYQPQARQSPAPYQPQARQSPAPYQPQARQSPAPYQPQARQSPPPHQPPAPPSPLPYQPKARQSPAPFHPALPQSSHQYVARQSPALSQPRESPAPFQQTGRQSPAPYQQAAQRFPPRPYQPPVEEFSEDSDQPDTRELLNSYRPSPRGSPMPYQPAARASPGPRSSPAPRSSPRGSPPPRQPLETAM